MKIKDVSKRHTKRRHEKWSNSGLRHILYWDKSYYLPPHIKESSLHSWGFLKKGRAIGTGILYVIMIGEKKVYHDVRIYPKKNEPIEWKTYDTETDALRAVKEAMK